MQELTINLPNNPRLRGVSHHQLLLLLLLLLLLPPLPSPPNELHQAEWSQNKQKKIEMSSIRAEPAENREGML